LDGRVLRRLLIALAVVLVLLIGADRLGVYIAETAAADHLKSSQNLSSTPDVDIAGVPFLTQLASGDFDEITVDASDVPVTRLHISHLHIVLHRVTASRSFSRFHVNEADATARITYADLSRALGSRVEYAGSGRVRASASVSILGRRFGGSVTARPELHGTSLGFGNTQVAGTNLSPRVVQALGRIFDAELPLASIPFDVRVDSLAATEHGIDVKLSGRNLSYVKR
jgi:hypothetical protein